MKEQPLISVLLPVFNGERYLAQAVESVLSQSCGDFELLIVDDGSTDRSLDQLREFDRRDDRIRLKSRPNRGLVDTLNEMLDDARGKYIARMDADDVCHPHRFERQMSLLANEKSLVCVGTQADLIDPDGESLRVVPDVMTHDEIESALLRGEGSAILHPSAMILRSAIERIGRYRAKFEVAQDLDLFLRLGEVGKLANVPEVLLKYRLHLTSIGHRKRLQQQQSCLSAVADAHARRGLTEKVHREVLGEAETYLDTYARWAWWALKGGNVRTARKYAWRRLLGRPLSTDTLRLVYCAARGH